MITQEFLERTKRDILHRLEDMGYDCIGKMFDEFDPDIQRYMENQIKKIYATGFEAGKKWRGNR